jgi:hypothetical protein
LLIFLLQDPKTQSNTLYPCTLTRERKSIVLGNVIRQKPDRVYTLGYLTLYVDVDPDQPLPSIKDARQKKKDKDRRSNRTPPSSTATTAGVMLELKAWHGSKRQYILVLSSRNFRIVNHLLYFTSDSIVHSLYTTGYDCCARPARP